MTNQEKDFLLWCYETGYRPNHDKSVWSSIDENKINQTIGALRNMYDVTNGSKLTKVPNVTPNQDHPLIKQIRLTRVEQEEVLRMNDKPLARMVNCENKLCSKLTALLDVGLPNIYEGGLNAQRIRIYTTVSELFNVQLSTTRDIFCEGADWYKSQCQFLLASKEAELKQAKEEIEELKNELEGKKLESDRWMTLYQNECNDRRIETKDIKDQSKDIIADLMSCTIDYCKLLEKCKGSEEDIVLAEQTHLKVQEICNRTNELLK